MNLFINFVLECCTEGVKVLSVCYYMVRLYETYLEGNLKLPLSHGGAALKTSDPTTWLEDH